MPIVSIRFAFEGGSTQDPVGKEGLAKLMTGLFDEGAGDLDSDAFQEQLDDAGAEMRFGAGRDTIYGSMRMLAEHKDEALRPAAAGGRAAALRPGADRPHPRPDRVRHRRRRARPRDGRRRSNGRRRSMATIPMRGPTRAPRKPGHASRADDLRAFHKPSSPASDLHVAVVGAIDAQTLKREARQAVRRAAGKAGTEAGAPTSTPKLDQQVRGRLRPAADLAAARLSRRGARRRRISSPPS